MENKLSWKDLRERTGMTVTEMASHLGISRQLYSMKENYKRSMRVEEAAELVRLAKVDLQKVRLR